MPEYLFKAGDVVRKINDNNGKDQIKKGELAQVSRDYAGSFILFVRHKKLGEINSCVSCWELVEEHTPRITTMSTTDPKYCSCGGPPKHVVFHTFEYDVCTTCKKEKAVVETSTSLCLTSPVPYWWKVGQRVRIKPFKSMIEMIIAERLFRTINGAIDRSITHAANEQFCPNNGFVITEIFPLDDGLRKYRCTLDFTYAPHWHWSIAWLEPM